MTSPHKVLMKNYSSLRIGGEADMVVLDTEEKIDEIYTYAQTRGLKVCVIGEGTNSFFNDVIKNTLFVKMEIKGIDFKEYDEYVVLTLGAGEIWDDVVKYSVEKGWWGIENMSFIPGTVGASPVQNIGAYGVELKDVLVSVRGYDSSTHGIVEFTNEECCFGYRDSLFKQKKGVYCITSITLRLLKQKNPILTYKPLDTLLSKENITSQDVRDLVITTRKEKLPDYHTYPNTGSFFKNPTVSTVQGKTLQETYNTIPLHEVEGGYKIPAAWLIEHVAEMKGARVKDVGTWPNQPLVLVNYGNATYEDVMLFSGMIVQKIEQATGIRLEREVNFVD